MFSSHRSVHRLAVLLVLGVLCTGCASGPDTSGRPRFETADAAFDALIAAMRSNDTAAAAVMLGPASDDVISSGDPVADREAHRQFLAMYDQTHRIDRTDAGMTLCVGTDDWPMPIPVVQDDDGWYFDTEEGIEEILDRRVGRNELATIQACLAYVDAQREYASKDRDGDGLLEYAQKIRSTPGKRDGLYWKTIEGQTPSPLGDLAAEASREGYDPNREGDDPRPYHGYYFRILKAQGAAAKGGTYYYTNGDSMIGGCALIAHPARHGISGVMTFIVNHDGVVFERDLGPQTAEVVAGITVFNPEEGWKPVSQP